MSTKHPFMRKIILSIAFLMGLSVNLSAQDKPAYKIFTKEGKSSDYSKMLKSATEAEVILFGELHNNAMVHWLQLQLTKDLYATQKNLSLGFEMFEADDQVAVNEYMKSWIDEKQFMKEAKIWDNYKTDYKPLLDFAKANKLPAIAANIPRRYASMVYKKGMQHLDSLPSEAKAWIAPLPFEVDLTLPGYKSMIDGMSAHGSVEMAENMARSQASKDATMAHFILKNRKGTVLHFNGAYHSQDYEGIVWYLKKAEPKLKILTIHVVEQDNLDKLSEEELNKADFIICIPSDMAKSY